MVWETATMVPDLVILLGVRSILSFVGISLIVAGTWYYDREEDVAEPPGKGRPGARHVASADYHPYPDQEQVDEEDDFSCPSTLWGLLAPCLIARGLVEQKIQQHSDPNMDTKSVCDSRIMDATAEEAESLRSRSSVTFIGWITLAISYLFDHQLRFGTRITTLSLCAFFLSLLMAVCHMVHRLGLGMSVRIFTTAAMASGMILQGLFATLLNPDAPLCSIPLGTVLIGLWYALSRGSGDVYTFTYDKEGRLLQGPPVYHYGDLLIVIGWFAFWVGMNSFFSFPKTMFLPIFLGIRTVIAFVGAISFLIVLWSVGYALDEMGTSFEENLMAGPGFGMNGVFVGEVREIKQPIIVTWFVLAISIFLPTDKGYFQKAQPYFVFVSAVLAGASLSFFHERAIRLRDPEVARRWGTNATILMIIMVAALWHGRDVAGILGSLGFVSFYVGQIILFQDRKRGSHWVETGELNPSPVVYSYGSLLTPVGMLLIAWAFSVQ